MKIRSLIFVVMVATVASLAGCERTPEKIYNTTDPKEDLYIAVKSVAIDNIDPTIKVGESVTLTATVLPEKRTSSASRGRSRMPQSPRLTPKRAK